MKKITFLMIALLSALVSSVAGPKRQFSPQEFTPAKTSVYLGKQFDAKQAPASLVLKIRKEVAARAHAPKKALTAADLVGDYTWDYEKTSSDLDNDPTMYETTPGSARVTIRESENTEGGLTISGMFAKNLEATFVNGEEGGYDYIVIERGQTAGTSSYGNYAIYGMFYFEGDEETSAGWYYSDIYGYIHNGGSIAIYPWIIRYIIDGTYSGYYLTPYWVEGSAFIPIENSNEAIVTFDVTKAGADGVAPAAQKVEIGATVTIPANTTLYKEGYTLTAWSDDIGVKHFAGEKIIVSEDITLTPVFSENEVNLFDRTTPVTLLFDFQQKNGAPVLDYQGKTGIYVTQAIVNGKTIDVKMDFDTNNGKIANGNWQDWCQINSGTKFTIPSCKGAVVSMEAYSNITTTTIDGKKDYEPGKTISYKVESDAETVDVVISDGSYYRYIQVRLPIPGHTLEDEEACEVINVERSIGMGYATTEATVDFTAAKKYLGVEELTTDMLRVINPDGSVISNYSAYDGWFNGEGAAEYWGTNSKICVKFFQAIPKGTFSICDMNGVDDVGKTYAVKWALTANEKSFYYINVKFVEVPVPAKDEEAPVLLKSDPQNGANDVPVSGNIVLTFNEPIKISNQYVETDVTSLVKTNGWRKKDGSGAGVSLTQFAPAIDTRDGRYAKLAENYENTTTTTGKILYQKIEGIENGTYRVSLYANAFYTSGRGFDSDMEDGATDVAYVFANDVKKFIVSRIGTSTEQNGLYTLYVTVTDGTLELGMGKQKGGTNWHTIQIKELVLLSVEEGNTPFGVFNGKEIAPIVKDNTITFEYSGLEYNKSYTFVLPANSVMDLAGNYFKEDITLSFTTSEHPANAILPFGQFSKVPWLAKSKQNPEDDWYKYDCDDSSWDVVTGPMSRDGLTYYNTSFPYQGRYWLRRHFNLKDVDATQQYVLYVTHDDDCVVWLNGTEVLRENFYHVVIYDSWYSTVTIDGSLLKEGDNVMAVYVHDGGGAAFLDFGLYTDGEVHLEEPGELALELSPTRIEEGTEEQVKLKVTRSGSWDSAETVMLKATEDSRITVPQTVTIPVRQSGAVVYLSVANNDVVDKDSVVEITAMSDKYEAATARLVIEDDEFPPLTVTSSKSVVNEGETFQLTITASRASASPLEVTLISENDKRFTYPRKATIPAGQTSVTVDVTVKDDDIPNEALSVAFTASAPRYNQGEAIVLLEDDDMPVLQLTLTPNKVQEGAGPVSVAGTLRRTGVTTNKITVRLSDDSNGGLYFGTRELVLNKGVEEANFNFGPIDNAVVDGDRTYTVTAAVWLSSCSCSAAGESAGSVSAQLQVLDDDGPALTLSSTMSTIKEGGQTTLTISRNTLSNINRPLTVHLSSDYDENLSYNHTVTIPAGQQNAQVEITSTKNDVSGDSHTVVFTVQAEGFASGTCWLMVTDQTLPDAVITDFTISNNEVEVGDTVEVLITVFNGGAAILPELTQINIYVEGYNTVLKALYTQEKIGTGQIEVVGGKVEMPSMVGDMRLYAKINERQEVKELLYTNNISNSTNIHLLPPYQATIISDKERYISGDTITLAGEVKGSLSANADVEIYLINEGVRQTLEAVTDENGRFSAKYVPYKRQMGHFIVGACYPGEGLSTAMGEFDVYGLYFPQSYTTCEVNKGENYRGFINFSNPGKLEQTDLKVSVGAVTGNCIVSFQTMNIVEAGAVSQIPFTIQGIEQTEGTSWQKLPLVITTNEGVKVNHTLYYYVHSQKAKLYTESDTIHGSVVIGTPREIPIGITNRGKGATGKITIHTGVEWISCVTGQELPSLEYGDSATIVLKFDLPNDAPLNSSFNGRVAVNCENGDGLALCFDMLTVSDAKGTLTIDVCDQYTYYTSEAPHLEGAMVTVTHPVTQVVMGTGTTNTNGMYSFELPAGQYRLTVAAPRHETLSQYVMIHPGIENRKVVNLGLNGVSIEMSYEETEVEDEYSIKTTVTYETNVPVPVVEAIIPDSLDIEFLGENESLIFYARLTNKGLITALNTRLLLPEPFDGITFTSLGEDMIDLAPQQSIVIPVKVTRGTYKPAESRVKKAVKIDFRCKTVVVPYYEEWCGRDHKIHKIPKEISLRHCGPIIKIDSIKPPEIGGGPGDGPIIIIIPIDPYTPGFSSNKETDDCNPCLFNFKHAIPNCGIAALDFLDDARKGGRLTKKLPEWFKKQAKKLKDMDFFFDVKDVVDTANDLVGCHSSDVSPKWKNWVDCSAAYLGALATLCTIYSLYAEVPSEGTSSVPLAICTGAGIVADAATCLTDVISGCLGGPISVLEGVDGARIQAVMPSFVEVFGKRLVTILPYYEAQKEYLMELFGKESFMHANSIELLDLVYNIKVMPNGEFLNSNSLLSFKPAELPMTDFLMFVERVNNTIKKDYGESISSDNFIHYDKLDESIQKMIQVMTKVESLGYESVFDMLMNALNELRNDLYEPRNSICAEVTLSIEQKTTMIRQAVRGKLKVYNGNEETAMKDVRLQFLVLDNYGRIAGTDKMEIVSESISGFEGDIDCNSGWALGPQDTGTANILFIPTKFAAPTSPQTYTFTGYISYIDPFTGLEVTKELAPATLTVNPSPDLELTYLMQRDVYGDDPLTEDVVEPMEEAEYALIINNKGYGEAKNVRMLTEQPKITENEKGLLIDFQLVSSQVNGEPATLSFSQAIANDFGTIAARSQAYAQWWLQSTLLGHFTSYEVEATHVTNYGNADLSLVDTVTIHEMVHGFTPKVKGQSSMVNAKRGWLVNDIVDADDMPDVVYFSDATQQPLHIASGSSIVQTSATGYRLSVTPSQAGWNYGSVVTPAIGKRKIARILRQSDGAELPTDNVWLTDRTLRDGRDWLYENRIHFVGDFTGEGETYLLTFANNYGDVNGDGVVDVADIASIISSMASIINAMAGATEPQADVNGDGVIDVADIATIISIMTEQARLHEILDEEE